MNESKDSAPRSRIGFTQKSKHIALGSVLAASALVGNNANADWHAAFMAPNSNSPDVVIKQQPWLINYPPSPSGASPEEACHNFSQWINNGPNPTSAKLSRFEKKAPLVYSCEHKRVIRGVEVEDPQLKSVVIIPVCRRSEAMSDTAAS